MYSSNRSLRVLSGGVQNSEAVGFCRIPVHDLGWRPGPLPNADAGRARELDQPAGALDRDTRPGFGDARPVRAVSTQHVGEDRDGVVALERHEGGLFRQPLTEGRLDSRAEWAEALGQVAQERDPGTAVAKRRQPSGELRLPGRCTEQHPGKALVVADRLDD